MESRLWTVVRFPAGIWSGGGKPSDADYEHCEVYRIPADSLDKAKKKAQSIRARLVKNGSDLPSQSVPYATP
ncbi:hypothetical protein [Stutzerimonas stutzeri]|uniref:hypothetical protein n=1 Tax=Stutzerimonas stutzeri TaxID=316 RepID=UPI001BCC9EF8|nr:hypothetical protein [Stutzerimonas stutzeri]